MPQKAAAGENRDRPVYVHMTGAQREGLERIAQESGRTISSTALRLIERQLAELERTGQRAV